MSESIIQVYDNWTDGSPLLIGTLFVDRCRGRETFSFSFDERYLSSNYSATLDPNIEPYIGRQYRDDGKMFGFISDAAPDRWGRVLMKRREIIRANLYGEKPRELLESDFLLGVYDEGRMGGLRFAIEKDVFLANDKTYATPPWTSVRELEAASIGLETDGNEASRWLEMIVAPGSSLGGARPKASVLDTNNNLWIAKFPSRHDDFNVGAWEMVAHDLAAMCGLNVPEAKCKKYSEYGSTFLVKRFDRTHTKRIHFASAMTMLGKQDGDSGDSSYLDIADFLHSHGASSDKDTQELWKRMVFNMLVSNTDDHLRNHGFLLTKRGWVLSPAYDINPNPLGHHLNLLVDDTDNSISTDLALSTCEFYGIKNKHAKGIIEKMKIIIKSNWLKLAKQYRIAKQETERMQGAFLLCFDTKGRNIGR